MKNELTRKNGYSDYDFFNEAMHDFFPSFYGFGRNNGQKYMRTDIKEAEKKHVIKVKHPGLDKKDIHIDLKDGYLNISVKKEENQEEGKKENYIHRERSFSCSRSYYVGDVRKEDIKAKYENGILSVFIPKETPSRPQENKIEIE